MVTVKMGIKDLGELQLARVNDSYLVAVMDH